MKRTISIFLAIITLTSSLFLTSCSLSVDKTLIDETVLNIEASEIQKAIQKCQTMNDATLKRGKDEILSVVVDKLNNYLNTSKWMLTDYRLVDEKTIEELKEYKELLSLLPLSKTNTNSLDFINKALESEKFIDYNDFYAETKDDKTMENIQDYINNANSSSSYSLAITYYKKAQALAEKSYHRFNGKTEKGMAEATLYYNLLSTNLTNAINGRDPSATEESELASAGEKYQSALMDIANSVQELKDIVNEFPTKIY